MEYLPPALEALVEHFAKLPGVGRKSAQRLAFHILGQSDEDAEAFAQAILNAKKSIHCCPVCQNLTEGDGPCSICSSPAQSAAVPMHSCGNSTHHQLRPSARPSSMRTAS